MNIKKELIKTIQNLMGVYFGKVYSANELHISDKSVGGKVEAIQADGSLTPVEDGEYVMDNGFAFVVKDGMIESIITEDANEPASAETPSEDKAEVKAADAPVSGDTTDVPVESPAEEAAPEDVSNDVLELEARVTALEEKLTECLSMMESMNMQKAESLAAIEAFNKEVTQLNSNIQTLAKVPVEFSKTNKANVVEESKEEKMMDIARLLGGLNTKK